MNTVYSSSPAWRMAVTMSNSRANFMRLASSLSLSKTTRVTFSTAQLPRCCPNLDDLNSDAAAITVASVPTEEQPEYGTLKIQCNVADASVLLDGETLGKASQVFKRLKPGTRNIVIQADGYQEIAQVVNVVAGQTTELTANLLSSQMTISRLNTPPTIFLNRQKRSTGNKNISKQWVTTPWRWRRIHQW